MNRKFQKMTTGIVTANLLLAAAIPVSADNSADYTKDENVYVRLEQDGEVDGVYVVNTFNVTKEGKISDFGDYEEVKNLTDLSEIEVHKDEQTFTAEEGKFYYQGNMKKKEIPWDIDITYELDGVEVEDEELEGAGGELEVFLKIRQNASYPDDTYFNTYALQATVTLDTDLCDEIQAGMKMLSSSSGTEEDSTDGEASEATGGEESSEAEAGNTTQSGTSGKPSIVEVGGSSLITFTITPGTEADLWVTTEVEDFEMDDISISGASMAAQMAASMEPQYDEDGNQIPVEIPKAGSFTSSENKNTNSVIFAISTPGVTIPDEEMALDEEEETSFWDRVTSLFDGDEEE